MSQENFCQEIFWKIKNHLLSQNKKCVNSKGKCVLRFENLKCAASVLIPDNDYSEKLEQSNFFDFLKDSGYIKNELDLIADLQLMHDFESEIDWPMLLQKIAESWNLRYAQDN